MAFILIGVLKKLKVSARGMVIIALIEIAAATVIAAGYKNAKKHFRKEE